MSSQAILEQAFIAAIANGYEQKPEEPNFYRWPEALIFNHDFAKALWGVGRISKEATSPLEVERTPYTERFKDWALPLYQWHLQQMVIAPDPIKYLGEHIGS